MTSHIPVMTAEVLQFLRPEQGGLFVDCTVGLGGHSRALLEAGASRVIGLDRDLDALSRAIASASASRSKPTMRVAPASSNAREWPPSPTVQSTNNPPRCG